MREVNRRRTILIPSYAFTSRQADATFKRLVCYPLETARRQMLCDYWTSVAVMEELASGDHPERQQKLDLLEEALLLEIADEMRKIAQVYTDNYLMPKDVAGAAIGVLTDRSDAWEVTDVHCERVGRDRSESMGMPVGKNRIPIMKALA